MSEAPAWVAMLLRDLLKGLPVALEAEVIARGKPRELRAGETLFAQDDAADALFVVEAGTLELRIGRDAAGPDVLLGRTGPDEVCGELELVGRSERGTSLARLCHARALTECRVIALPYASMLGWIAQHPPLERRLARVTVSRLAQLAEDLGEARFGRTDILLARHLVTLADELGLEGSGRLVIFRHKVAQETIAAAIGVTREQASRRLNEWQRAGLLRTGKDQRLILLDLPRLRAIAGIERRPEAEDLLPLQASIEDDLARGNNYRARNAALELLEHFPGSSTLRFQATLAAARAGALAEARSLVSRFGFDETDYGALRERLRAGLVDPLHVPDGEHAEPDDEDVDQEALERDLGRRLPALLEDVAALLPRLDKDRAFAATGAERQRLAATAAAGYARVFAWQQRPYSGINAATMSFVAGEPTRAMALAGQVLARLPRRPATYWDLATAAEAHLLLGETEPATQALGQALQAKDATPGAMASTRLQLERLAEAGLPLELAAAVLPRPAMLAYTGHILRTGELDAAGLAAVEDELGPRIEAELRRSGCAAVYGALARGGDLMIAEAALACGAALHVVLPMREEDFRALSVVADDVPGAWLQRYERCLEQATSLTVLQDGALRRNDADGLYFQAARLAAGLALLRADELRGTAGVLALSDGGPADTMAGTAMAVRELGQLGLPVTTLPCPWRHGRSGSEIVAPSTWRPIVFAWIALDRPRGRAPRLDAARIDVLLGALEAQVRDSPFAALPWSRRVVAGQQLGLAFAVPDPSIAVALAQSLVGLVPEGSSGLRVVCDFGRISGLVPGGPLVAPIEDDLARLRAGHDLAELPTGTIGATEVFAAEARLVFGEEIRLQSTGRVSPAGAPLPSVRLFRIDTVPKS